MENVHTDVRVYGVKIKSVAFTSVAPTEKISAEFALKEMFFPQVI